MKLFVVGETEGIPEAWSIWSEFHLVVAETASEAVRMIGEPEGYPVCEVEMTEPAILYSQSEPSWDRDI